jgi:hypothetical protein
MNTMLFAGSLIAAQNATPRRTADVERFYTDPRRGLWDVARVTFAIGGVAVYAGILAATLN